MDDAQKALFKLLLEIDEICKKYDIQYFMEYGTALGAVRHEGFIPWDNDIDLSMTEDNYNKWVEVCKKELDPEKRAYSDGRLNREYPVVFGRYINLETTRISNRSPFWQHLCGQCIDIFCLMELPKDPKKKQKAIDRYYAYDEYFMRTYRHYRMKTDREMRLYNRYTRIGNIIGRERMLRILEKKIFNHHYADSDTYMTNSARKRGGPASIVPKSCYDTVYMADFEGHKLPIPGDYIKLLIYYYGDAYCMIPEEKIIHSEMSDTGIKCADYVDNYMRYINKDTLLNQLSNTKNHQVEEGWYKTHWAKNYYGKLAAYEKLKLEKTIALQNIKIEEYLDVSDMKKLQFLSELFEEYYTKQLHKEVLYWEAYIDIGDELVYAALITLFYYRRNYSAVLNILEMRRINKDKLDGRWEELYELIQKIRKIKADIYYGNYPTADELLKWGLGKYPYCHSLRVDRLFLDVLMAENEADLIRCEQAAKELLDVYADDEQCQKALGDIAYKREDYEESEKYYSWIMEHSSNGMYHLDIRKKREAYHD